MNHPLTSNAVRSFRLARGGAGGTHAAVRTLLAHVRETLHASRSAAVLRSLSLLLALGFAAATNASFAQPPCTPAADPAKTTLTAEFTGRFVAGAPVYRLPALTVTTGRNVAVVEAPSRKRGTSAPTARARSAS